MIQAFLRLAVFASVFLLSMHVGGLATAEPAAVETSSVAKEASVTEWICPMECDGLRFDKAGDCPLCGMHLVAHKETKKAPSVTEWICPMECDGLRFDEAGDCPVCGMRLVPHKEAAGGVEEALEEGGFFAADLMDDAEVVVDKPAKALMPGLTHTHFWTGLVLLFLLTLVLAFALGEPRKNMKKTSKRWDYPRFELTSIPALRRFVTWKGFQPLVQIPVVAAFILVIVAGLIGNQDPSRNIAPVLTWNIWWMGLIFFAFFAGEIWCTVCPWMAIPDWVSRLGGWASGKTQRLGLHRRWPKAWRNLYPAIAMFVVVTWLELAYEVPYRPALTAMMAIGMVVMAASALFVFERKGFCRYVCLVGRVTGAYGMTGMLEIRRKDTAICHACSTKDCLHGNDRGLPCPTSEFMGAMNENTYCTMCTECLKTCPNDNIGINVRAPLADLMGPHRKRLDEAWLLLMILGVTWFHGLAMVPAWTHDTVPPLREWLLGTLGVDLGYLGVFTIAMAGFFGAFVAIYWAFSAIILKASGNLLYRTRDAFIAFIYPLVPIALAYHLAHNSLHFFYEGSKLVRLVSDPFGWGWNLFGTVDNPLTMLIPIQYLWIAQVALVLAGQVASVWLMRRAAFRMFGNRRQATRAMLAGALVLFLLGVLSMWLLNQPMEMRTA